MSFAGVRAIADAVLLEGYVLYPYRASSTKNRYRWTFGVVAPKSWSESSAGSDPWWMQTDCLVQPRPGETPRVEGVLRFLQMQRRTVEESDGSTYREVGSLVSGGATIVPWEEGLVREVTLGAYGGVEQSETAFELPASRTEELIGDAGRIVRRCWTLRGRVVSHIERDGLLVRVRLRIENLSETDDPTERREDALRRGLLSAHVMLRVTGGDFVSLIDPPASASAAVERSRSGNVGLYPVLGGREGERDLLLASPIILYDHPAVAPESPGDFFDSGEIDELLQLRTATLTEEEKREVRALDPRAAALLDRVEHLPPEMMERLHGAIRALDVPASEAESAFVPGKKVRLCPGARRTDAQDVLFAGRTATVRKVMEDIDGQTWLAVTIDDDPAAEMHEWYGRFHYYYPDEVELLESQREAAE